MYRAGGEGLLGLARSGADLVPDRCFRGDWPQVSATVRIGDTRLAIAIVNPARKGRAPSAATLDDTALHPLDGRLTVKLSGRSHRLAVTLGEPPSPPAM